MKQIVSEANKLPIITMNMSVQYNKITKTSVARNPHDGLWRMRQRSAFVFALR